MEIMWCFHGLYTLYSFLWHFRVAAVPAKFFSYAFPEEIWYWKDGVKREWNEIYSLLSLLCSLTLHILLKIDTDTWSKCGKVILVFWVHSGYRMINCIRFWLYLVILWGGVRVESVLFIKWKSLSLQSPWESISYWPFIPWLSLV